MAQGPARRDLLPGLRPLGEAARLRAPQTVQDQQQQQRCRWPWADVLFFSSFPFFSFERERERAIEKTLVDLLENSVYVPRWGQHLASKPTRPAERETKAERSPEEEAEGTDAPVLPQRSELMAGDYGREHGQDSHGQIMEAGDDSDKLTVDRETLAVLDDDDDDYDSNISGGSGSVAGKRKNAEQRSNDEEHHQQRESSAETGGEEEAVVGAGDELSSSAVADDEKEAEGSPATKRRRLPNVAGGHPSPVRLAKRRTSPSQSASGVETSGTEATTTAATPMMLTHNNAVGSEARMAHHDSAYSNQLPKDSADNGASNEEGSAQATSPAATTEDGNGHAA